MERISGRYTSRVSFEGSSANACSKQTRRSCGIESSSLESGQMSMTNQADHVLGGYSNTAESIHALLKPIAKLDVDVAHLRCQLGIRSGIVNPVEGLGK